MDRKAWKNFITKRSSIWTMGLCMTGIIVLGGISAVNRAGNSRNQEPETEAGQVAYIEEELPDGGTDNLLPTLDDSGINSMEASGNIVEENVDNGYEEAAAGGGAAESGSAVSQTGEESIDAGSENAVSEAEEGSAEGTSDSENTEVSSDSADASGEDTAEMAASDNIISQQTLLENGVSFTGEESILWPAAGTILIDYSMDGSVYFPTLNQYKYNPAVIIGSETGNQVLASARGIVESIRVDEETGTTLVLNIGNGYRLTYGQLKEVPVTENQVVEEGGILGYVSEPTKYFAEEGSNLYFAMTKDGSPVDPVLYLE